MLEIVGMSLAFVRGTPYFPVIIDYYFLLFFFLFVVIEGKLVPKPLNSRAVIPSIPHIPSISFFTRRLSTRCRISKMRMKYG
jgi:hypothetical protein